MAAPEVPRDPVPALTSGARLALAALALVLTACGRVEARWPDGTPRHAGRLDLHGERHGEWVFHYPDGSLRERGRYDHGRRTGLWRQWHRGGELASEGERSWDEAIHASRRVGPWSFWDPDGTLRARRTYGVHPEDGPAPETDPTGAATPDDGAR